MFLEQLRVDLLELLLQRVALLLEGLASAAALLGTALGRDLGVHQLELAHKHLCALVERVKRANGERVESGACLCGERVGSKCGERRFAFASPGWASHGRCGGVRVCASARPRLGGCGARAWGGGMGVGWG